MNLYKRINKLLELSIFSILFIIPLAFWLSAHESFETPKSIVFFVLVILSLFLFIYKQLNNKKIQIKITTLTIIFLVFITILFLSFLKGVSINKYAFPLHWQFFKLFLFNFLLYFIIINIFNKNNILKLLRVIIFSHAIVVTYGILQYFGIDFIKWVSFGEGRVYSTMGNPDYMAAQFSIIIPVIITLIFSNIKKTEKLFLSILLSAMFFLIIVSHGRGAWLGFSGSLFFLFLMFFIIYGKTFYTKYKFFIFSLLGFFIFLVIIFSFPNNFNKGNTIIKRIKHGLNLTSDSVVIRLFYWESALQMGIKNPLLGVGIGGFALNSSFYQRKVLDRWKKSLPELEKRVAPHVELYTHNDYLQTLAETGFLGFGVFLWIFVYILFFLIKKSFKTDNILFKNILIGLSGSIVALLINSILNFPLRVVPTLILIWSIFAIISIFETKKIIAFDIKDSKFINISIAIILILVIYLSSLQIKSLLANICIKYGQKNFISKNYKEAKRLFLLAFKSNPKGTDLIELTLYTGNVFNALKDINTAIKYYDKGIKLFPNFIEAHYNIGNVYLNNGLKEKALKEYKKVLALNPKFVNAINNMANIYFDNSEFEKAKEMYLTALKYKPDTVQTLYNLGATYFRMKQYKKAYETLKKVLEIDPDYTLAKEWMQKMKILKLIK